MGASFLVTRLSGASVLILLCLVSGACTKVSLSNRARLGESKTASLSTTSLGGGGAGVNNTNCHLSQEEQDVLLRDYPGQACGASKVCPMPANPTPFVSVWRTTQPNEAIHLPLDSGFRYDFTVDWGDGTTGSVKSNDSAEARHVFATPGDHVIQWNGCAEGIALMAVQESAPKLIQVLDLGRMGWRNLHGAFMGAENLVSFAGGDTSDVVDMTWMFSGARNLAVLGVSGWNTSKVTRMVRMFEDVTSLQRLDIGAWDTSSVSDFSAMFSNMTALEDLDVSGWDTSSAETMSYMFVGAGRLSNLDLSHFKTARVTNMMGIFGAANGLVELNLKNWVLHPDLDAREAFEGTDPALLVRCDASRGGVILGRGCSL